MTRDKVFSLLLVFSLSFVFAGRAEETLPKALRDSWMREDVQQALGNGGGNMLQSFLTCAGQWYCISEEEALKRGTVLLSVPGSVLIRGEGSFKDTQITFIIKSRWIRAVSLNYRKETQYYMIYGWPQFLGLYSVAQNAKRSVSCSFYPNYQIETYIFNDKDKPDKRKDMCWDALGKPQDPIEQHKLSPNKHYASEQESYGFLRGITSLPLLALFLSPLWEGEFASAVDYMLSPYANGSDERSRWFRAGTALLDEVLKRTSDLKTIDPIHNAPFLAQLLMVNRSAAAVKAAQDLYARPEFPAQLAGACGLLANGAFKEPLDKKCIFSRAFEGEEHEGDSSSSYVYAPRMADPIMAMAAMGLGESPSEEAAALLIAALEKPGRLPSLQRTICEALGANGSAPAVAALRRHLNDADAAFAAGAFKGLLLAGDIDAVPIAIEKASGENGSKEMQQELLAFSDGLPFASDGAKWRAWWEKARQGWPRDAAPDTAGASGSAAGALN